MAKFILTDASILINSVDLSDHCKKIAFDIKVDEIDMTSMGNGGYRSRQGGMKQWTATVDFFQDFAAAKVDASLFPILGTSVPCVFKPTTAAVGATNPSYTGNGTIYSHNPLNGEVSQAAMTSVTIVGDGPLARAIV